MPPPPLQLQESATVVLDGSGNGQARISPFGPRNGGLTWDVQAVAVSATSNVIEAQASAYVAYGVCQATADNLVGQTATGSSGDTCGLGVTLQPGDCIIVKWTGGDVGARATMRLVGTINPPGT